MRIMAAFGAMLDGMWRFILILVGAFPQSVTGWRAADASRERRVTATRPEVRSEWNIVTE